jgi:hypothetical protein
MLLPEDLKQFTGGLEFYKHPLIPRMVYTEGVQYFAKKAGAYWFIDKVATELENLMAEQPFISLLLTVKNDKATLSVTDGNELTLCPTFKIDFTDAPEGEWRFWIESGGGRYTLLLPSEH